MYNDREILDELFNKLKKKFLCRKKEAKMHMVSSFWTSPLKLKLLKVFYRKFCHLWKNEVEKIIADFVNLKKKSSKTGMKNLVTLFLKAKIILCWSSFYSEYIP